MPQQQWLAEAEAAYARSESAAPACKAEIAAGLADRINRALENLGITPVVPAAYRVGGLVPALLVESDPEEELYSVHADWDATERRVRLALGHYWNEYTGLRPGRLLGSAMDVVKARREGPSYQPEPKQPPVIEPTELRKIAERTAAYGPRDGDSGELAELVAGLAATVLYLADTVARTCGHP